MTVKERIKSHSDVVDYFKELRFYNKHIWKLKVKHLKNIDLLSELPFHEELSVLKTDNALGGYTMSYKVEIVEEKDPLIQLEASKTIINDLFKDLFDKTKGVKYQITLKVMLKNTSQMEKTEFQPVHFNSTTKNSDKSYV